MSKLKNEINSELVKSYGLEAGAGIVGIAAAGDFGLAPEGFRPSDALEGCRSVIVLGTPFERQAFENPVVYTEMRNAMLKKMTATAKEVEKRIKAGGHKAKAISASGGKTVDGSLYGHISLKHAAQLAGLGIIGRNYLLISPVHGTLLWLSAVLTDADLAPDEKIQWNICGGCDICAAACPSGALDDPAAFGKKACAQFFKIVNKKLEIQCCLCRKICPYAFGSK